MAWKLKKDMVGGVLQLILRWLCRAAIEQNLSEQEVMMIEAPSYLVVFIYGIWMLADEEPLARSQNMGAVAHVT